MIIGRWKLKYKKKKSHKKPKKFSQYYKRNDRLSELGYGGYQEYLKSDEWRAIREDKVSRFPKCLICLNPSTQVHHLSYVHEVLLGLVPELLVCLCEKCHEGIEFDEKGEKRNLKEANKTLRLLAFEKGRHRWLAMVKKAHERMKVNRKALNRKKKMEALSPKKGMVFCQVCQKNPVRKNRMVCRKCKRVSTPTSPTPNA